MPSKKMRNFLVLLFHAVFFNITHVLCDVTSFTAAVYEHRFITISNSSAVLPKSEAVRIMMANIDIYEFQIKKAKEKGVDIIVFPEYGMTGIMATRQAFRPFLEDIPDPQLVKWNACEEPNQRTVLTRLSCLAKQYSIYIVVNMGDMKVCKQKEDCPKDGLYQYNTAVAFDKKGYLIARYHKQHPFMNEMKVIDRPLISEYITFDTDFGKFGLFTCFDVLFYEPAVKLVETMNIDHVAFPTAWYDVLPLFSAVGFHGSWAKGMQVNFLAANTHIPKVNSTGSGIYGADGDSHYYRSLSQHGSLTIASLKSKPKRTRYGIQSNNIAINETSKSVSFYSDLFGDKFLFQQLTKKKDSLKVCYNETTTCCHLQYEMVEKREDELYAVGVFDGLHTLEGQYYLRVCTLIKCSSLNKESCGRSTNHATTVFQSFTLRSELHTSYVFPQLVSDGVSLSPKEWQFDMPVSQLQSKQRLSKGLITATLFGRVYKKDNEVINISPALLIPRYLICLLFLLAPIFNV